MNTVILQIFDDDTRLCEDSTYYWCDERLHSELDYLDEMQNRGIYIYTVDRWFNDREYITLIKVYK